MALSIKRIISLLLTGMFLLCIFRQLSTAQVEKLVSTDKTSCFRANERIIKIRDELPGASRSMSENSMNTGSRNLNQLNEQFGVTTVEQVFRSRTDACFNKIVP